MLALMASMSDGDADQGLWSERGESAFEFSRHPGGGFVKSNEAI